MKKTFLSFLILCSLTVTAQKPDAKEAAKKATQSKDSVNMLTVPLFSIADLEALDRELLSELPSKHTDLIRAWIRQRLQQKLQTKK